MKYDFSELEFSQKNKLMASNIIPRPIAWIVTENNNIVNVAPFSYFTGLSSEPATMIVSIGKKSDGSNKDTYQNLIETKKCVVCIVDDDFYKVLNDTAIELPKNESEVQRFGLDTIKVFDDFPPIIKGVSSAFFCELFQIIEIGGLNTPVILEIKKMFVDDKIIKDKDNFYFEFKNPLARIGKSYSTLGKELNP
jgi:flavin reductase (DIM6/NTAB) family NADH-FMN oxidoreductase RutF